MVTIVVGAQWGDEGKGKIIDFLARKFDVMVRYQGGANAGHTVNVEGERFIFHLLPSAILHPGKKCAIASGVVVDPEVLLEEIRVLQGRGYLKDKRDLLISDRAHIVFPFHKRIDVLREERRKGGKIGTTGRGISTAYEDKAARRGIRFCEFVSPLQFRRQLKSCLEEVNRYIREVLEGAPFDLEEIYEPFSGYAEALAPYMVDTSLFLDEEIKKGSRILLEGAQGSLLDIDHGSYPYVTSSNSIAGGALTGAGIGPTKISEVTGIAKAYTTRVGFGPFPTQMEGEPEEWLREKGNEYGATTGRPRRCGWFDAVIVRYAARINGFTSLALTKLDVLTGLSVLRVAVAYRDKRTNKVIGSPPANLATWENLEPIYKEELPGWQEDISSCRSFSQLPFNAQNYLRRIQELVGIPIKIISVGEEREQTISKNF